jgi:hypothetical protein
MPKNNRRQGQEFTRENPASSAGLDNTASPQSDPAPATVPATKQQLKRQAKMAESRAAKKKEAEIDDQVMNDPIPQSDANLPSTAPDNTTEASISEESTTTRHLG